MVFARNLLGFWRRVQNENLSKFNRKLLWHYLYYLKKLLVQTVLVYAFEKNFVHVRGV